LLQQSPLHAWLAHPRLNPNHQRETDAAFDRGAAAHAYVLENREDTIVVVDAPDWRTKLAKEARDEARAAGKQPLLTHQLVGVKTMKERLMNYISGTELRDVFESGTPEQSLFWEEGDTWCRARPDLISADRKICVDYKTTESANPDDFGRQIGRMNYDLQAEWYTRGLAAVGESVTFVFVVQEVHEPYACSLVALSNAYREVGAFKAERALNIWRKCVEEDRWPAYPQHIAYAEPTTWQLTEIESEHRDW
jgi:hypothetical protein